MIIPARNIPRYFHTLSFPLALKPPQGDQVCGQVDRDELLRMIDAGEVVAIGSAHHIRYLRRNTLTPSAQQSRQPRSYDRRLPRAEDDVTVVSEVFGGGVVYRPHLQRCAAYCRELLIHAMQCHDSECLRCAELRHTKN